MSGRHGPLFDGNEERKKPNAAVSGMDIGHLTKITCASCETIIGMSEGGMAGSAYCSECIREAVDDVDAGDAGDDGEYYDGDGGDGGDGDGGDGDGGDGDGGVENGGRAGSDEQARRLAAIVRSLEAKHAGAAPTRREVVDGMVEDGTWKTAEDADRCLDGALNCVVFEPTLGRLSLINGEWR